MCALVLAALFAERRRQEAALKESNDRLQLALALGSWASGASTSRRLTSNATFGIVKFTGTRQGHGPQTPAEARGFRTSR